MVVTKLSYNAFSSDRLIFLILFSNAERNCNQNRLLPKVEVIVWEDVKEEEK